MESNRDKQERSVFVGNISYETSEEEIKKIFAQVGPVLDFKLVYDRESGKSKGYGFIEYEDIETAESAVRNLGSTKLNGRQLRVGPASQGTSRPAEGPGTVAAGVPIESPYGEPVPPVEAPEDISQVVASLPPEQMFELMKQMKRCIQNNPQEARAMLLKEPQLAYALLQAQIVMKIVDPQVAMAMLHRENTTAVANTSRTLRAPLASEPLLPRPTPASIPMPSVRPPVISMAPKMSLPSVATTSLMGPSMAGGVAVSQPPAPRLPPPAPPATRPALLPTIPFSTGPAPPMSRPPTSTPTAGGSGSISGVTAIAAGDQEKAQLIMEVLKLSEEQIAALPAPQQASIRILKERVFKSQ